MSKLLLLHILLMFIFKCFKQKILHIKALCWQSKQTPTLSSGPASCTANSANNLITATVIEKNIKRIELGADSGFSGDMLLTVVLEFEYTR